MRVLSKITRVMSCEWVSSPGWWTSRCGGSGARGVTGNVAKVVKTKTVVFILNINKSGKNVLLHKIKIRYKSSPRLKWNLHKFSTLSERYSTKVFLVMLVTFLLLEDSRCQQLSWQKDTSAILGFPIDISNLIYRPPLNQFRKGSNLIQKSNKS